jgi:hypothetical protein
VGFFNEVGRRAEKLKQQVSEKAEEGAMFECADCGKGIFTKKETCPACGSESVVPREPEAEDADASAEGAAEDTEGDVPGDIEREEFETEVDDTERDTEEAAPAGVERVEFETEVGETDDSETQDTADGDENTA